MISKFESGRNILKFLERSFKLSLHASIMQWSYSNCITNIKVNVSYYLNSCLGVDLLLRLTLFAKGANFSLGK